MAKGIKPPLESDAQAAIFDLATLHGWRYAHWHDSRREVRPGVFVGDKAADGFPDCTFVRDRLLVAEFKRKGEKPRFDQVAWLDALAAAGVETYLWMLDDLDEIGQVLGKRWDFTPFGLIGPGVNRHWEPGSQWVAGHGRRDAA